MARVAVDLDSPARPSAARRGEPAHCRARLVSGRQRDHSGSAVQLTRTHLDCSRPPATRVRAAFVSPPTQPGIAGQSILANSTADSRHSVIPGRGRRLTRLLREQEEPRSIRGSRTARVRPPISFAMVGARLSGRPRRFDLRGPGSVRRSLRAERRGTVCATSDCRGSPTGRGDRFKIGSVWVRLPPAVRDAHPRHRGRTRSTSCAVSLASVETSFPVSLASFEKRKRL